MTKPAPAPTNPMEFWQQTMSHWMPTACTPTDKPTATLEPFELSKAMANPFMAGIAMWQQSLQFWQNMMPGAQPQAPATPKVTFDFGDMNAYMQPAMQAMQQWQQMWMKGMGGK